jgi:predicted phosphodiesterase
MKIVIVSDTHGQHDSLGELEGDVLIHCGDFCLDQAKADADLDSLDRWFARQRFRLIVCTGGNHDFLIEDRDTTRGEPFRNALYLRDRDVSIDGLKIHGAP